MGDREELARDIFIADNSNLKDAGSAWDNNPDDLHHDYAYAIADGLIAAGWVKGREEWGVRCNNGTTEFEIPKNSEDHARDVHEHYKRTGLGGRSTAVVRRTVTDWEEA